MASFNLGDAIRNATPTSFTPIPAGNYEVTVESAEFTFSKAGSNPMFKLTLVVDDGEPGTLQGDHKGRKLFSRVTFTEKSVDLAVGQMAALGIDQGALAEALGDGGDPADICRDLIDAPAIAKVVIRDDEQYGVQNDVKRLIARPSAPGAAPAAAPRPAAGGRPARPF